MKNGLAVNPEISTKTCGGVGALTPNELKLIADLLPDAFILLSASGSILAANRAAHQLFHTDDLVGLALGDFVTDPPSKVSDSIERWTASPLWLPISFNVRADGAGVPVCCEGRLLRAGNTNETPLILARCTHQHQTSALDLVDRLKNEIEALQKQLIQQKAQDTQQITVLRTAAAVFAHEIANPLNAVSTCVQLLQTEIEHHIDWNSLVHDLIESASTEIDRLTRVLNDFRSFARPQAIDFRPIPLSKVIEEALAAESSGLAAKGIAVEVDLQPMPPLMLDGDKMKEAISILCKNAEEAMPGGGRLTISGQVREQENVIVLKVTDTGSGVPAGVDVFQLFVTTKPGASGLGLPIAAQIVASHGGCIQQTRGPGPGTTFEILLPLSRS